jgi:(4S)-4-hydroxy-5-phosphonooxypentane-2,3-dione isomerase
MGKDAAVNRYVVVAEFLVRHDHIEPFLALISRHAKLSRAKSGCEIFEVTQEAADSGKFLLFECCRDEDAYKAHRATEHYAKFREIAPAMLVPPCSRPSRRGLAAARACQGRRPSLTAAARDGAQGWKVGSGGMVFDRTKGWTAGLSRMQRQQGHPLSSARRLFSWASTKTGWSFGSTMHTLSSSVAEPMSNR